MFITALFFQTTGCKLADDTFNLVKGSAYSNKYLPDSFRIALPNSLSGTSSTVTAKNTDPLYTKMVYAKNTATGSSSAGYRELYNSVDEMEQRAEAFEFEFMLMDVFFENIKNALGSGTEVSISAGQYTTTFTTNMADKMVAVKTDPEMTVRRYEAMKAEVYGKVGSTITIPELRYRYDAADSDSDGYNHYIDYKNMVDFMGGGGATTEKVSLKWSDDKNKIFLNKTFKSTFTRLDVIITFYPDPVFIGNFTWSTLAADHYFKIMEPGKDPRYDEPIGEGKYSDMLTDTEWVEFRGDQSIIFERKYTVYEAYLNDNLELDYRQLFTDFDNITTTDDYDLIQNANQITVTVNNLNPLPGEFYIIVPSGTYVTETDYWNAQVGFIDEFMTDFWGAPPQAECNPGVVQVYKETMDINYNYIYEPQPGVTVCGGGVSDGVVTVDNSVQFAYDKTTDTMIYKVNDKGDGKEYKYAVTMTRKDEAKNHVTFDSSETESKLDETDYWKMYQSTTWELKGTADDDGGYIEESKTFVFKDDPNGDGVWDSESKTKDSFKETFDGDGNITGFMSKMDGDPSWTTVMGTSTQFDAYAGIDIGIDMQMIYVNVNGIDLSPYSAEFFDFVIVSSNAPSPPASDINAFYASEIGRGYYNGIAGGTYLDFDFLDYYGLELQLPGALVYKEEYDPVTFNVGYKLIDGVTVTKRNVPQIMVNIPGTETAGFNFIILRSGKDCAVDSYNFNEQIGFGFYNGTGVQFQEFFGTGAEAASAIVCKEDPVNYIYSLLSGASVSPL